MNYTKYIPTKTIPIKITLISKTGNKLTINGNKVVRLYKIRSDAKKKQKGNEKIFYDAFEEMWYNIEFESNQARQDQELEMKKFVKLQKGVKK